MNKIMVYGKVVMMIIVCLIPSNMLFARGKKRTKKNPEQMEHVAAPRKKTISHMTYEELEQIKNELMAAGYKDRAAKYLQKMRALTSDAHTMAQIMLDLADVYFDLGKLVKAEALYQEYVRLYLGSSHVEYASYRAILCGFYEILDADRDQTKTKATIALCEQFLFRSSVFREFKSEVDDILVRCREHLFLSDLSIARYYAGQGRMLASQLRLASIEKEFEGKIANVKPRLLIAECEWARWNNDVQTTQKRSDELAQNFPNFKQEKRFKLSKNVPVKQYSGLEHAKPAVVAGTKRDFVTTF